MKFYGALLRNKRDLKDPGSKGRRYYGALIQNKHELKDPGTKGRNSMERCI